MSCLPWVAPFALYILCAMSMYMYTCTCMYMYMYVQSKARQMEVLKTDSSFEKPSGTRTNDLRHPWQGSNPLSQFSRPETNPDTIQAMQCCLTGDVYMYMYIHVHVCVVYLYKEPDSIELSHGLSVLWRPGQQVEGSHTHFHHLIHVHTILHIHTHRGSHVRQMATRTCAVTVYRYTCLLW